MRDGDRAMIRLLRYAFFVPLAVAGAITVISAQTMIIFGALFFGFRRPAGSRSVPDKHKPGETKAAPDEDGAANPASAEMQALAFLPLRPIKPDSLILMSGEVCYLQENATLTMPATEQQHVGGVAGFSLGRMRGPRVNLSLDGHKVSRAKTTSANGRVYITNSRLVFIGAINVNIHLAQILTLDLASTGAALSFVSEQPMEFATGNPRLGIVLLKVVNRSSDPIQPS